MRGQQILLLAGLITISTGLPIFASAAQVQTTLAPKLCVNLLKIAHSKVAQIYSEMKRTSNWSGSPQPVYFKGRNFNPPASSRSPRQQEVLEFVFDRLNDPESFRDFLNSVVAELATDTRRSAMVGKLKERLIKKGFQISPQPFLRSKVFFELLAQGTLIEETDDALLESDHGLDTHLIQMAYLADPVDHQFGDGRFLEFIKHLGREEGFIWTHLFDKDGYDHLGHPSLMTFLVRPLGLE